MIDVTDLDKAEVLAALYNAAGTKRKYLVTKSVPMGKAEAARLLELKSSKYFGYLSGRVMNIEIGDRLDECLYDRDNGAGAAQAAIDGLRSARSAGPTA